MSLFRSSIAEKPLPKFDKSLTIQEIMQRGQQMYPQWKFLHFKEGKPTDIMVIIPVTRIVKIKIPAMMVYEKETSQTFQHLIIFDIIDYHQHLSYDQVNTWENYSHKHYGVSDAASAFQRLQEYQESL